MIHCRYYIITFGLIVGTEVLYRCLRYIVKRVTRKADTMRKNYTKVIFFPDKGITSNSVYQGLKPWQDLYPQKHRENNVKESSLYSKMECDQMKGNALKMEVIDEIPSEQVTDNLFLVPKACQEQMKYNIKHSNHTTLSCNKENSWYHENSSKDIYCIDVSKNPFAFPVQPGRDSFINMEKQEVMKEKKCNYYSEKEKYVNKKNQNPFDIDERQQITTNCKDEQFFPSILRRSTSLVHMVNAILSAKRSVVICVYVFTCKILAHAVIKVKHRGVNVRVLVEEQMINSSMEVIKLLQRHNILVWFSQSTFLMHHKFAVIDGPMQNELQGVRKTEPLDCKTERFKKKEKFCLSGLMGKEMMVDQAGQRRSRSLVSKDERNGSCSDWAGDGVLMNGSFNWTWGAIVHNNENVVITNNPELVWQFAGEFENIWKAAAASVTWNSNKRRK